MDNFVIDENNDATASATVPPPPPPPNGNKRLRGLSEILYDPHDGERENTIVRDNAVVAAGAVEAATYTQYKKNNALLKYTKKEKLRAILDDHIKSSQYFKYYVKKHEICVSKACTIPQLKEAIIKWYSINIAAEKLQSVFRGSIIRKWISLRGPALRAREVCTNETDFCTLEPLVEIENRHFFSYKEPKSGCIFGFDIRSLWSMYKKKGIMIMNPSTKNLFIQKTKKDEKHNRAILKDREDKKRHNAYILDHNNLKHPYNRAVIGGNSPMYKNAIDLYFIIQLLNYRTDDELVNNAVIAANYTVIDFPLGNINNFTNQQIIRLSLQSKINDIRNRPLVSRINEAFMDIGYLDFYTNANWFFNMNRHQCYVFLQRIKNIWDYGFRNNYNRYERILDETKNRICFLHDPFLNVNFNIDEDQISAIDIQTQCIYVIENFIYLGIDTDNRKLGAMYVLAALTTVSNEARSTLNWLYENFNL